MECLTNDEDRVPRNLIDACVSKGDAMLDQLQEVLESPMTWSDDTIKGLWWLPIHMIHILGLIPDARAGEMLIRTMVRLWEDDPEHALIEWVSGYWPALFASKPPELLKPMREMIADRNLSSYLRGDLVGVVLAAASRRGADSLDAELDMVASLAASAGEHENFRDLAMLLLLRFPRERHRVQLEDYARAHGGLAGVPSSPTTWRQRLTRSAMIQNGTGMRILGLSIRLNELPSASSAGCRKTPSLTTATILTTLKTCLTSTPLRRTSTSPPRFPTYAHCRRRGATTRVRAAAGRSTRSAVSHRKRSGKSGLRQWAVGTWPAAISLQQGRGTALERTFKALCTLPEAHCQRPFATRLLPKA